MGLGHPIYNATEVSEAAGISSQDAQRLWRAMGFVVLPEDEKYFTESDLATLVELAEFIRSGFADFEMALRITRTMSQNLARVTEAEVDGIRRQLSTSSDLALKVVSSQGQAAGQAFGALERFLVHVWRRHLADALKRAQVLEPPGAAVQMAVGFADIVGFTRLSGQIDEQDLEELVEHFEALAQQAATEVGGRIVKTIGDEAMFVAHSPDQAAEISLALVEQGGRPRPGLMIRVGGAVGELISHHGDYFGPTVNVASRAARVARPNSVLVTSSFASGLSESSAYCTRPIPLRALKGIGPTQLFVVRRKAI